MQDGLNKSDALNMKLHPQTNVKQSQTFLQSNNCTSISHVIVAWERQHGSLQTN